MIPSEAQRGRGEGENVKKEAFFFFLKKGLFGLRVVPNGVDATTAEWEGGATRFIQTGQGICSCARRKKNAFTTTIWWLMQF